MNHFTNNPASPPPTEWDVAAREASRVWKKTGKDISYPKIRSRPSYPTDPRRQLIRTFCRHNVDSECVDTCEDSLDVLDPCEKEGNHKAAK